MQYWTSLWIEMREVAWLASVIGVLSLLGIVLAFALVVVLDGWSPSAPGHAHVVSHLFSIA